MVQSIEVIVAIDEATGKVSLSVADKSVSFEQAAPVLRRVAATLGIELGPDTFKGLSEPERHIHLHEDRARVQHRQRV